MILNFIDDNIFLHTNDLFEQHTEDIKNTVNSIKNEFSNKKWDFIQAMVKK